MATGARPDEAGNARFDATVAPTGGTTTGIRVPEAVLRQLGSGRRPKVAVTLADGYTYRTTIGTHEGSAFLPVSAAVRDAGGIAAGDRVAVQLVVDDVPRAVAVPDDLSGALQQSPAARSFFDGLTDSQRKTFVLSVTGAKTAPTRVRRVAAAVAALQEGRKRP